MDKPSSFLSVVLHNINEPGDDLGLCAGFERGKWRAEQLAEHVMEWLPEFALNYSELKEISHHNAVKMTKKAARTVYQTEKYGSRGEFGELLLHIAIRQIYSTIPAVSKIYYKSAVNKTVEGFDAVHIIKKEDGLELWIGETKFYNDINKAISDVCAEIIDHLETDYLRSEFLLISNKIDPAWPEATELKSLLDGNTTLDEVFERACVPVLLTYDSNTVQTSKKSDSEYKAKITTELQKHYTKMRSKLANDYKNKFGEELPIVVHVILIPLNIKKDLATLLDSRLKELQK